MLDRILAATRRRLPELRTRADTIRAAAVAPGRRPPFASNLVSERMTVIAEIKRRSPSRGDLAPNLDPVALAVDYAAGGASGVSVLTETEHFGGLPADLTAVAGAVDVPVLCKDFVLDEVQVWEAAAWGASAVLLIVAALDDPTLAALLSAASDIDIETLVEVHSAEEARRAMAAGAVVVGVNNRDLSTFEVDLATAEKIAPLLDEADVRVAESGIFSGAGARRMADAGYHSVLVGEGLVRSSRPADLVRELRVRR